jgi:hypothetical protein
MRTLVFPLWFAAACAEESSEDVGIADSAALPPPRFAEAWEFVDLSLAPGVFLLGNALRFEAPIAPRTGDRRPSQAWCAWSYTLIATSVPSTFPTPTTEWAFEVSWQQTEDLRLSFSGQPSRCSAVFNGAGGAGQGSFSTTLAYDLAQDAVLLETPAGWTRHAAGPHVQRNPGAIRWDHVFAHRP